MSADLEILSSYLSVQDAHRNVPNGTHLAFACEREELFLISNYHHLPHRSSAINEFARLKQRYSMRIDDQYLSERWEKFYSAKFVAAKISAIESIIIQRDSNSCQYCGSQKSIQLHHVIPVKFNGANSVYNLVCACSACNQSIGTHIVIPLNWWKLHPESKHNPGVDLHYWATN